MQVLSQNSYARSILVLWLTGVGTMVSTSNAGPPALPETLEQLRDMSLDELSNVDIIRMNLIVAREIEPSIDISYFERLIDQMAEHVKLQIDFNEPFFEKYKADFDGSKEKWICTMIWQIITEDFGLGYLKGKLDDLDHSQPWQKFVHGLLTRREGTCCTLPVLYLAIAQRLGYPRRSLR